MRYKVCDTRQEEKGKQKTVKEGPASKDLLRPMKIRLAGDSR